MGYCDGVLVEVPLGGWLTAKIDTADESDDAQLAALFQIVLGYWSSLFNPPGDPEPLFRRFPVSTTHQIRQAGQVDGCGGASSGVWGLGAVGVNK